MPKKDDKELKVVNVRLVDAPSLYSDEVLDSPEAVSKLIAKEFKTYDREVCAVINLNVKLKPININICSVGTIDTSILNPREVFKSSILSNAAAFMLVHNHPSGETTPSREDKALTKRLIDCGDLLNIKMIDHLIIGSGTGDIYSFKEEGLFETLSSNPNFDIRENRVMERNYNSAEYRYADKEKTQTSSSCATLQLRGAIPQSFRFNAMIHNGGNIVNGDGTMDKDKVYLNVHNNFAKIGLESKFGNGQTFNAVTIPKGSVVDGKDISGGTIYPLDMYIYKNKFNDNLTTVQFHQNQEVQVNFKNGEHIKVKAEDLCESVTQANKEYLDKNKNIEKSTSKIADKYKDIEL